MKTLLVITITLLSILLMIWVGVVGYKHIIYNRECEGHLKRAADSNTIELAEKEIKTALKYLEQNNMTSGYTSILYQTPDEDITFWYSNLKQSLEELQKVTINTSQLERSNLLIKLRETLLDQGKDGANVTSPNGISRYPSNTLFAIWGWLSILGIFMCGIIIAVIVES